MADKLKAVGKQDASVTAAPAKQLSGTGYPYFDFNDSLTVARLIQERGGGICDVDQLAAWLNYKSTTSGTFASRLASARHFGLIGPTVRGKIGVADRARAILAPVMSDDAVSGRAEAFLGVGLYRLVFDRFRGTTLPPPVGLGNLFEQEYRILPDRKQQAVRVFLDSAAQTGFFQSAPDRLIRPSNSGPAHPEPTAPAQQGERHQEEPSERRRVPGNTGGGGDGSGIDPSLLGLLRRLPQPGVGWTRQDQEGFLEAFRSVVKFLYPAKGEADGA